jgi:3-isopropylmalate/(R)-2-methylmalate dehydratase small subunit
LRSRNPFAGQTVKAEIRSAAHDALINGRWDAIGELLDGLPAVKATAAKLAVSRSLI